MIRRTERASGTLHINGLLEEKHASGYAYGSEEKVLDRFDGYCIEKRIDLVNRNERIP